MDADSRVQFTGDWEIPYIYYGIFDGHAGSGCAVTAANELHQVPYVRFYKPRLVFFTPFFTAVYIAIWSNWPYF